jgi:hypothetical protein
MTPPLSDQRKCTRCDDDGYVEQWTWDDHVLTYECPLLREPWHAPFNATGILGSLASDEQHHEGEAT